MEEKKLLPIPTVGEYYHFWDDGKSAVSRHYIAKVERIISIDEAKVLMFDALDEDEQPIKMSLYEIWEQETKSCYWLYATETECFVECSIPKYDDNFIYFSRTKDGGWFSFGTTGWWQSGQLDVNKEKFNAIIEYHRKYPEDSDIIEAHMNIKY